MKTVESPLAQFAGRVVDVPVIRQMDLETKHVKIPRTPFIDKVVDIPVGGTTGPAISDHAEDGVSPAGAVSSAKWTCL